MGEGGREANDVIVATGSPEFASRAPNIAVVCGSDSLGGAAVAARLRDAQWEVLTVDPPSVVAGSDEGNNLRGEIWDRKVWSRLEARLRASGDRPSAFIHAYVESESESPAVGSHELRSVALAAEHLLPLIAGNGAVVFITSVLAEWDTQAGMGDFSAGQAGILAAMRAMALARAPAGIRANAVCTGLVASGNDDVPDDLRGRIPLGRAATPSDVADAVFFLLSPDARHISGSTLVVDGGQSLQSWSNAPREGQYPGKIGPIPQRNTEGKSGSSDQPQSSLGIDLLEARFFVPQNDTTTTDTTTTDPVRRRFEDRTVVITGAAGGLGSAAARRFAMEGGRLALLDRDLSAAEELAAELAAADHEAVAIEVDVADEASIAAAITRAEAYFGRIDVMFNNAGEGGGDHAIAEMAASAWDDVIAVNLRGVFLGCKHGVPALKRAGGGAIVNMGSSTGRHDTITGGAVYMASKAGVEAMTKSLALQVAPLGIRANTICPGIIQTQLSFRQQERGDEADFFAEFASRIPLGRVGQPEDVAAAVAFLASDQAGQITGSSLLIDGGQTLRKWISAPDLIFTEERAR